MEDGTNTPAEPATAGRNLSPNPPTGSTDPSNGGFKAAPRWVEAYPRAAGVTSGTGQTNFLKFSEQQRNSGQDPWAPFESQHQWQLTDWLLRNVGQNATDEFLKLPIVSNVSCYL